MEALPLLSHYPNKMIYKLLSPAVWDLPMAQMVKNLPAMQETGFDPWVRKIHWRSKWQSTPVFLLGESHGHRSLAGSSPWAHKESDTHPSSSESLFI